MSLRQTGKWTVLILLSFFLYGLLLELQIHFWGRPLIPHEQVFLGKAGSAGDPKQFMWFLNWWNYALSHHINPLYSDFLWHPTKVSTLWVASIPLLSFLTAPLLKAYGIVFTYNLIVILSPILAATTAFTLCFYLTRQWLPSFLGGFFFGFSPYEMENLFIGDFNLSFIAILPLIVLLAIMALEEKGKKEILLSFFLGILLSAEFLVSTEIFAILVLFSFFSIFLFFIFSRNELLIFNVLKRIGKGLLFSILMLAPLIPTLLHGGVYGSGKGINTFDEGNDLLVFMIPPKIQLISYGIPLPWYKNSGGWGYLGLPAILIAFIYARSQWKFPQERFLSYLMGFFMLLSLGATFHLFGLCLSPLPWSLAEHLPLISYAQPSRFLLYFWLVFSIVVSFWLSRSSDPKEYLKKLALIFLAIVFLWDKPWPQNRIVTHPIFSQGSVCKMVPKGKTLLYFPWGDAKVDYHQLSAHMCFKAAEGYYGGVPSPFNKWPINYLLAKNRFKEMSPDIFHQYLSNFDVGLVIISKTTTNRSDLENLLSNSGFQRSPDLPEDPTVEIYKPGMEFVYKKLTDSEMQEIFSYRERSLREEIIASNREKLKKVVYKLGFSSDKKFQDIYTWLLAHHILK